MVFIMCAGYRNRNNSRVRSIEARIRKGELAVAPALPKQKYTNASSYARTYMRAYIVQHSQSSPSDTILYLEHLNESWFR